MGFSRANLVSVSRIVLPSCVQTPHRSASVLITAVSHLFCICSLSVQTLQMGIRHFSGLFVLLCVGVTGALLTLAGEHAFYHLVLPHIRRRQKFKYWLHTSQVSREQNLKEQFTQKINSLMLYSTV